MTHDILFVSGWGGYPELFPVLSKRGEFLLPFIRHDERYIFERLEKSPASTLIAWSTGAHMALKRWRQVVANFDKIVLVAPFLSFTDYTSDKVVRLMIRGMRRNATEVVRQFLGNCGYPGTINFNEKDTAALKAGLEYLLASRAAPSHLGGDKTVLIHGEHDRIISNHASEDIWEVMPQANYTAIPGGHFVSDHEIIDLTL